MFVWTVLYKYSLVEFKHSTIIFDFTFFFLPLLITGHSRRNISRCKDDWAILLWRRPPDSFSSLHWGSGWESARLPSSVHWQNYQLPQAQAAGLPLEESWAGRQRHRQEEVYNITLSLLVDFYFFRLFSYFHPSVFCPQMLFTYLLISFSVPHKFLVFLHFTTV